MTDIIQPSVILKPQMLSITSKAELYRCYMPFIKGGALFIPFNDDITPAKINPVDKIILLIDFSEQTRLSKSDLTKELACCGDNARVKL